MHRQTSNQVSISCIVALLLNNWEKKILYYILINEIPFALHVFWSYDTDRHIKLTFSESVPLSLKVRWEQFNAAVWRFLSLRYTLTPNVPFEKNKMASTLAASVIISWSVHKMQGG